MTGCRRNFIAGGGFLFERRQDVQRGDGFRKGSTPSSGLPLMRSQSIARSIPACRSPADSGYSLKIGI
jgi:hypothetical protein